MKYFKILVASLLGVVMFAGCSSNDSTETDNTSEVTAESSDVEQGDKSITIALSSTPKNFDPILYTGAYESQVISAVAETLVTYNNELDEILPVLANDWTVSEDGTEYTFNLRDDVYFQPGEYQDGRQMVAEDVKYSLMRSAQDSALDRLSMLTNVEVVDDFTVKCTLDAPDAAFLTALTDAGNSIVPQEEVEGQGDGFNRNLIGTGPFKIQEFNVDQDIELVKNDNYWGGETGLDEVTYVFISDINSRLNALKNGEIDIAADLTGEAIQEARDDENIEVLQTPALSISYVYFNMQEGPTADPLVREAMIKAVDVESLVGAVFRNDEASRAYLPLPPGSWGYDETLEADVPEYDPEGAKELLAEAGYEDGFTIDYYVADRAARVQAATILSQMWKDTLNIDVNIQKNEWGTFSDIASSGQAGLFGMSWSWYPDPYFFLDKLFDTESIGSLGNGQGYSDPEVDQLLDDAVVPTTIEERTAVYQDALDIIVNDDPMLVYANEDVVYGIRDRVEGFSLRGDGRIVLYSPETNVTVAE